MKKEILVSRLSYRQMLIWILTERDGIAKEVIKKPTIVVHLSKYPPMLTFRTHLIAIAGNAIEAIVKAKTLALRLLSR